MRAASVTERQQADLRKIQERLKDTMRRLGVARMDDPATLRQHVITYLLGWVDGLATVGAGRASVRDTFRALEQDNNGDPFSQDGWLPGPEWRWW